MFLRVLLDFYVCFACHNVTFKLFSYCANAISATTLPQSFSKNQVPSRSTPSTFDPTFNMSSLLCESTTRALETPATGRHSCFIFVLLFVCLEIQSFFGMYFGSCIVESVLLEVEILHLIRCFIFLWCVQIRMFWL